MNRRASAFDDLLKRGRLMGDPSRLVRTVVLVGTTPCPAATHSFPVTTSSTPGAERARLASMASILACARLDRSTAA